MEYTKNFLSFDDQADLLIQRGLIVDDRKRLVELLHAVNYYRLSAYWHPFRTGEEYGEHYFKPGTTLDLVWDHYCFDRDLRFLCVDAIEAIENVLRTQVVYLYTQADRSPFDYADEQFEFWGKYRADLDRLEKQAGIFNGTLPTPSRFDFVNHFFEKYGDCHQHLPFWMFIDIADFGFISNFLRKEPWKISEQLSNTLNLFIAIFKSWVKLLNEVRNSCAHHVRIWNVTWETEIKIPYKSAQREWYCTYSEEQGQWVLPRYSDPDTPSFALNRTGIFLIICRYLLREFAPQSQWHLRVEHLFKEYGDKGIDFSAMGLPAEWMQHPLWR